MPDFCHSPPSFEMMVTAPSIGNTSFSFLCVFFFSPLNMGEKSQNPQKGEKDKDLD